MTTATRSRPRSIVTWEELAEARPLLADALYTAQRIQRRSPGFCATRVWYRILKPIVVHNAGWSAAPRCPMSEHFSRQVADIINNVPLEHTDKCRAEWARAAWLQTSEAYETAYETIYEALPDCQHADGGCG